MVGRGGVAEDECGLLGLLGQAVRAQAFEGESALCGAVYRFVLGAALGQLEQGVHPGRDAADLQPRGVPVQFG